MMGYYLTGGIAMAAAVILVLIIVIQNSKGGGINSAFGTSNLSAMIGNRRANQDIEKLTWYFAAGLLVLSLATTMFANGGRGEVGPNESKATRGLDGLSTQFDAMPQAPMAPAAKKDS
jgi:preprotein translocase subunit SecG